MRRMRIDPEYILKMCSRHFSLSILSTSPGGKSLPLLCCLLSRCLEREEVRQWMLLQKRFFAVVHLEGFGSLRFRTEANLTCVYKNACTSHKCLHMYLSIYLRIGFLWLLRLPTNCIYTCGYP